MEYFLPESVPSCQWPDCSAGAVTRLFNSASTESAYLCTIHRRVAATNLELYDKIKPGKNYDLKVYEKKKQIPQQVNPIVDKMREEIKEEWEVEAARKADALAEILDQVGPDELGITLPKPRAKE